MLESLVTISLASFLILTFNFFQIYYIVCFSSIIICVLAQYSTLQKTAWCALKGLSFLLCLNLTTGHK